MSLKTEHEHLRELIDALSQAESCARMQILAPSNGVRVNFGTALRTCVVQAQSLSFYRNQRGWGQMAALLDEAGKRPIRREDWPKIADALQELSRKATTLGHRRAH
jgi:hypothetical protein